MWIKLQQLIFALGPLVNIMASYISNMPFGIVADVFINVKTITAVQKALKELHSKEGEWSICVRIWSKQLQLKVYL